MSVYATEHEQLEAVKKWWSRYGKFILAAALLGLAAALGWWSWQYHLRSQSLQASNEYQQMLAAMQGGATGAALALGENLVRRFPSTPYATLAALTLADLDLEIKNFTAARTYLHWVMDHAGQPGLRRVARLRLAQVLQAEGKTAAALAMLKQAEPGPFTAAYDELEGDLYRAQGKPVNARAAYRKALAALPASAANRALLQTKLDDVAAAGAQGGRP